MSHPKRRRTGAILLEVIVAMAILSVAAVSAMTFARQASFTIEEIQASDARLRTASRLLDAVALWPREDLDRHLGDRPEGPWILHVDRPLPTLYRVAVYDAAGRAPMLETALFRAIPPHVAP